jgi:hypothetical protein
MLSLGSNAHPLSVTAGQRTSNGSRDRTCREPGGRDGFAPRCAYLRVHWKWLLPARSHQAYNRDMTVQTFRELLTQQPFKPFRLVMSSGQTYEVRHPEMAMLTRTDLLVGIGETDEGVPAEFKICSLLHVSAVEPLSGTEAKQTGNA